MPRLGALEGQLLSDDLSDLFNLPPKTGGFLVKTVAPGSPGEAMGIKAHEPARRRPGVHDGVARGAAAEAHPQDAVNA